MSGSMAAHLLQSGTPIQAIQAKFMGSAGTGKTAQQVAHQAEQIMPDTVTHQEPVQRQEEEDDQPVQIKAEPVQRQEEDDDQPVQMKAEPVQRQEEEDDQPVQMKAEPVQRQEEDDDQPVQAKQDKEQKVQAKQPSVNLAPTGAGQPMPKAVQQKMEGAFGADFSGVRIYEGPQAKTISALAYTQGSNIHFQPGKYQPHTQSGQKLLGHELTHVLQQRAGRVAVPQKKGIPINADSRLETEADVLGAKAAQGEPVQVAGATKAAVQSQPLANDGVVQCASRWKRWALSPLDWALENIDSLNLAKTWRESQNNRSWKPNLVTGLGKFGYGALGVGGTAISAPLVALGYGGYKVGKGAYKVGKGTYSLGKKILGKVAAGAYKVGKGTWGGAKKILQKIYNVFSAPKKIQEHVTHGTLGKIASTGERVYNVGKVGILPSSVYSRFSGAFGSKAIDMAKEAPGAGMLKDIGVGSNILEPIGYGMAGVNAALAAKDLASAGADGYKAYKLNKLKKQMDLKDGSDKEVRDIIKYSQKRKTRGLLTKGLAGALGITGAIGVLAGAPWLAAAGAVGGLAFGAYKGIRTLVKRSHRRDKLAESAKMLNVDIDKQYKDKTNWFKRGWNWMTGQDIKKKKQLLSENFELIKNTKPEFNLSEDQQNTLNRTLKTKKEQMAKKLIDKIASGNEDAKQVGQILGFLNKKDHIVDQTWRKIWVGDDEIELLDSDTSDEDKKAIAKLVAQKI
ncbi:MAG: DUF4157 domain-containing protein [Oscillatoria princeps RMCB-10]|nr:DUF4157 domain-containing protein [Oscillatoria princeps RMCB-10]